MFPARVPTWPRCEKGNVASGFGATAANPRGVRFRGRPYHAAPASLIDDDHHLHVGPGRVIRLGRELVLPLGLLVRDAQYFAHEPSTLHCYQGSERLAARPSRTRRGARERSVALNERYDRSRASPRHARARGVVRRSRTASASRAKSRKNPNRALVLFEAFVDPLGNPNHAGARPRRVGAMESRETARSPRCLAGKNRATCHNEPSREHVRHPPPRARVPRAPPDRRGARVREAREERRRGGVGDRCRPRVGILEWISERRRRRRRRAPRRATSRRRRRI